MNKEKCFDLVCPECGKSFEDCKSWPAYHNCERWQCPYCGHVDDSWRFRRPIKKESK